MFHTFIDMVRTRAVRALPAQLVAQVRKYRRRELMDAYLGAGLVFLHVPRTAGTSISSALYGMQVNHFPVREMLPLMSDLLLALPRFAIVRNPWDRAVSAWSFARNGGGTDGKVILRSPLRYRGPEFQTFEQFVHDWLSQKALGQFDGIFRPQADFLLDQNGKLPLDHLGRFENLPATEAWLNQHNPAMRAIPHFNAAVREPYRNHYTPASRDAVAKVYARDIELFGYDF
ncbi:MAG: sulfotransferase family 2 domain-containing protein [Novosphingobium sp.]|uniref:sulfotransferase family 2 domain-containing protein n=1 Tax=Novosphingobium sp. TaxID=1874826 RepID=UPI0032B8E551